MIVVMKPDATTDQIDHIVAHIGTLGLTAQVIVGTGTPGTPPGGGPEGTGLAALAGVRSSVAATAAPIGSMVVAARPATTPPTSRRRGAPRAWSARWCGWRESGAKGNGGM